MSIKLSTADKKILKSLDKGSKWFDVKGVKDIDEEIQKLEIYEDFIGLGCSRYLNEAGEIGKLDVDEMFRNCREAEKVRVRVKKKEVKEERKAGAGRRGRGGGGSNVANLTRKQPVEITSKQTKSSPIVSKALEVKDSLKGIISKSLSGDGWKGEIVKLGLSLTMDTLFGIVLAVMELSETNPLGAVVITTSAMSLIYEVYNFISETETGKKILGKGINLLNELYNYLIGNDINVIKKTKKKKKPPTTDEGSRRDDDDDDDDDDDSGDSFILDKDELNTYTTEEPQEETKQEETKQDTLQPSAPEPPNQAGFNALIPFLHAQQAQQNQALRNENDNRLLQQNLNNPTQIITDTPPTSEPKNNQPTDQQNTQPDTSLFTTAGLGVLGGLYSGFNYLTNNILNAGNPQNYNQVPLGQPLTGEAGSGIGGTGQEVFDTFSNDASLSTPAPNTEPTNLGRTNTPTQEGKDMIEKQQEEKMKKNQAIDDLNKKVQEQIDNMDNLGKAKALGLFAPSFGKTIQSPAILRLRGPVLTLKPKSVEESKEQFELLNEVEARAEETRLKGMENSIQEEDRKMTQEEYNEYIKRQQISLMENMEISRPYQSVAHLISPDTSDYSLSRTQSRSTVSSEKEEEEEEIDLMKQIEEIALSEIKQREDNKKREMSLQRAEQLSNLQGDIFSGIRQRDRANQRGEQLSNLQGDIFSDIRQRTANQRGEQLSNLQSNILNNIRQTTANQRAEELPDLRDNILSSVRQRDEEKKLEEARKKEQEKAKKQARERARLNSMNILDRAQEQLPDSVLDIVKRKTEQRIQESNLRAEELPKLRDNILTNVRGKIFGRFTQTAQDTINQMTGRGRRPAPNRMIIYQYLGRPYNPASNPQVSYTDFYGRMIYRFPQNVRQPLSNYISNARNNNRTTRTTLNAEELQSVVNIIQGNSPIARPMMSASEEARIRSIEEQEVQRILKEQQEQEKRKKK
jgi:hypothetical protein